MNAPFVEKIVLIHSFITNASFAYLEQICVDFKMKQLYEICMDLCMFVCM